MAAQKDVTLVIRARDRTRAVFRRIGRGIRRFRVGLGGLVAGGAFAALTKGALDFATNMEGAAARVDVTTDSLQGLKILGEDLNIPFASLVTVMQRLSRNAGQALGGDVRLVDAFADLGVTMEDLSRLNTEDLFLKVADAAADTSRSWRETSALIAKVGDTEAVALRGLLVQGGDALRDGVRELKGAGRIQGAAELKAAAEAEAAARRELIAAQKAFTEAIVTLTPVLQEALPILKTTVESFTGVIEFSREHSIGGRAVKAFANVGEFAGIGRNITGTADDPAVKAAILRTAQASEKTAATIDTLGTLN